jgi:RNA-directed DNA polymerase
MIQQTIAQVISPYFEPQSSPHSDGYRPGKRACQAVDHVQTCIKQGYKTAVDIDLSKCFDEANHDMLMNRVGRKIKDKALMQLLGKYLRAGIVDVETSLWFPSDKKFRKEACCRHFYRIFYWMNWTKSSQERG